MDKVNSVQELIERTKEMPLERTKEMPLERMRFFINEDKKEARCFGIYQEQDTGHWVVYKNKADGSRAVRYSGPDEAYAAQELWAKIQSEIELRRAKRPARKRSRAEIIYQRVLSILLAAAIAVAAFLFVRWLARSPSRGYYLIDDIVYYCQDNDWYYYDDGGDWMYYDEPVDYDWYNGHYYGTTYAGFEDAGDAFEASGYYVEPSQDDDSDDSDIFDSWDSGDTDWSSDW